jgi:hypothetical protein
MGEVARQASLLWGASSVRGALLDLYSEIAGPVAATDAEGQADGAPSEGGEQTDDAVTQLGVLPSISDDSGKTSDLGANKVTTDPAIAVLDEAPPEALAEFEVQAAPKGLGSALGLTQRQAGGSPGALPWVESPSPAPQPGLVGATRGQMAVLHEPDGAKTPRTPMPAHRASDHKAAPTAGSNVIVDDALFDLSEVDAAFLREATAAAPPTPIDDGFTAPNPLTAQPPPSPAPVKATAGRAGPLTVGQPNKGLWPSTPPPLPTVIGAPPAVALRASPSPISSAPPTRSSNSGVLAAPPQAFRGTPSPPPLPRPKPSAEPVPKDEVVEVLSDDVIEVSDEALESQHASPDEVIEADSLSVDPTSQEVSLPPSALDPWLAQLVHGYCPPESQLFARHVPPTTMPGRD